MSDQRVQDARSLLLWALESLDDSTERPRPQPSTPHDRTVPPGPSTTGTLAVERNRLFNFGFRRTSAKRPAYTTPVNSKKSKKQRLNTWCHDFVCLWSTTTTRPPSSLETADLIRAGLGRKQLTLFEGDGSHELHTEILNAFPCLHEGGGYELMHVGESGQRSFHVIPSPSDGYSVTYLKEVLRQAKFYIRPMQKDLTLDPCDISSATDCPCEDCIVCGKEIALSKLQEHLQTCRNDILSSENYGSDIDDDFLPPLDTTKNESDPEFPAVNVLSKMEEPEHTAPESEAVIDLTNIEQAFIDEAVAQSLGVPSTPSCSSTMSPNSLSEALLILEMALKKGTYEFEIRRDFVLCDLLRAVRKRACDPLKRVKVWFVGEEGRDTGGLSREMWRLFDNDLQRMCEGKEGCLLIKHDATKLQEGLFRKIGMLIGVSLVQGGSGVPFFAPCTYQYICSGDVCSVLVGHSEVPRPSIDVVLDKITSAGDDDCQLRAVAMEEFDVLQSCGFRKPIASLTSTDVPQLIEIMHACIYERKAELDQMVLGLQDAGVLEMIRKHPTFFKPLFVNSSAKLCAGLYLELKYVFISPGGYYSLLERRFSLRQEPMNSKGSSLLI